MNSLTKNEIRKFLRQKTLFRQASATVLDRLTELAAEELVVKGQRLFSMGQECESLRFVVSGSGYLVRTAPDGRQRILHRAGPGDMVGCAPFFDGQGYPASFYAETECTVLAIPREPLLRLLREHPEMSFALIGALVKRLRMMESLVEKMSFADTERRLWDYLMKVSRAAGKASYPRTLDPLPTREHMATVIGTVREVVSRRLSRLSDTGHIRIEGRRLTLLKPLESATHSSGGAGPAPGFEV